MISLTVSFYGQSRFRLYHLGFYLCCHVEYCVSAVLVDFHMERERHFSDRNQFFQDELQSLEGIQPVSRSCKEYALLAFLLHSI
jgi:hypothetical protein